jgi:Flp pilus assembly protein TadG
MGIIGRLRARVRAFTGAKAGNVALTFALAAVPLTLAMGAGIDYARGLKVHSNMADALDAAGLAVGAATTKPTACSSDGSTSTTTGNGTASNPTQCSSVQQIAQRYFNANFVQDSSADTIGKVNISISNESVTLSVSDKVPTTFLAAADRMLRSTAMDKMNISASSTVVWGQTKLWVALVLDNTGSMTQTDSTGTSKLSALKTAAHNLVTTLEGASTTVGDVQMSLTTFAKLVNVGTGNVSASWVDWTDWSASPVDYNGNADPVASGNVGYVGPGDKCPYTNSKDGFVCVNAPATAWPWTSNNTSTIPSSGSYKGYICPGVMNTYNDVETYKSTSVTGGHYFNGCWTSTANGTTKTVSGPSSSATCNGSGYANCSCTGSGSSKVCTTPQYTYAWVANPKSSWSGCIEDRTQDYDTENTAPSGASLFPAANDDNCPVTAVTPLPATWTTAQWTTLNTEINKMTAQGSTNQTIGLAHGWQSITTGSPYGAPALPANTSQYIILVSDGLNTQDRWYGDGSDQSNSVDTREGLACTNAKAAGIVIYTIYVDLNGTQGSSTALKSCATDSGKYFDLTTSGAIITTLNNIAEQITDLRVSK